MWERGVDVPARAKAKPPSRIRIEHPAPTVDAGRYPVKRTVGDTVHVSADIFRDGHEVLRAVVRWKGPGERRWRESPLTAVDAHHNGVRWEGAFTVETPGRDAVEHPGVGRPLRRLARRACTQGRLRPARSQRRAQRGRRARACGRRPRKGRREGRPAGRGRRAADGPADRADPELLELVEAAAERTEATELPAPLEVDVDRTLARFGSWYELFPRSWGGFRGVQEQVGKLAELGFDVLYMPPIHPIGHTSRKGRNNTLTAEPGDPGSPYAIGDETGGHDAIHPDLGTDEDFRALVATANEHNIDVCLDLAINCSPDHPWLKEHPEWFFRRPDGTLKYAENPPKKYQDIYNVNFGSEDWCGLWDALLGVVQHWVDRGVKVFRVDNPHTKPFAFWEWLITEIRAKDPDVIFFAEAFTRRSVMRELAKIGFSQSYTYFTWKNHRWELMEYVNELAHGPEREYFRPNFFLTTPDILTDYLAHGGPPAFPVRLILGATLSPSYGVYSGYEHYEHVQRPGQRGVHRQREVRAQAARARRAAAADDPAPQPRPPREPRAAAPGQHRLPRRRQRRDPRLRQARGPQRDHLRRQPRPPSRAGGPGPRALRARRAAGVSVEDLLDGTEYHWRLGGNYVRLDPSERAGHVLRVRTA